MLKAHIFAGSPLCHSRVGEPTELRPYSTAPSYESLPSREIAEFLGPAQPTTSQHSCSTVRCWSFADFRGPYRVSWYHCCRHHRQKHIAAVAASGVRTQP